MADVWQRTGPLSHQQERIYLVEGLDSGSDANNFAFLHWIDGDLDRPALTAAVAELHRRHAIRSARYPDGANQSMSTPDGYRLAFSDLSADPDPVGEVRRLLDESVNRLFDLAAEAPVRWTLYALGPGRHALTLVVHNIAFDVWSTGAIDIELSADLDQWVRVDLQATPPVDTADLPRCEEVGDRSAPRGTTEQAVAALFTELLGHKRIGVDDNFFALGGHSLLAARLVALVRKDFQVELTLLDLFENPTVAGVTAFIEDQRPQSSAASRDPYQGGTQ